MTKTLGGGGTHTTCKAMQEEFKAGNPMIIRCDQGPAVFIIRQGVFVCVCMSVFL